MQKRGIKRWHTRGNAKITRDILNGAKGPKTDAVLKNAGAGLYIGGKAESLADGIMLAREIIGSGKALETLEKLILISNEIKVGDEDGYSTAASGVC